MTNQISVEERISNLRRFLELWHGFGAFVQEVASKGHDPSGANGTKYQTLLSHVVQDYPRVQKDIQVHGIQVMNDLPGFPDSDPFLYTFTTWSTIGTILNSVSMAMYHHFMEQWRLGRQIILYCIGILEFAQELGDKADSYSLQESPATLVEILSAIRRALRPAFKEPPENEPAVQDQLEVILRAQGVEFEREAQIEHSTKKVKPDFALPTLGTALEVKFCNSRRREKEIIEEIGADIVAYRKKYEAIVFIVYDVATISDKESFRRGFDHEKGVLIEIVS